MVNIEFTSGESTFKINSISLVRNFHSYVHGNKLRIVNAYDTRNELLPYTRYSDISVNGVVYGSVAELAQVLSNILFLKKGGADSGGVTTLSGNIITKVVPVQIDWTQDSIQQIVNYVNSREFEVLGTQRILFKGARIIGDVETSNAVEFYYWEFKPGKGNYGLNGTPILGSHIEYISFVTNYQNNVINLGEIGTVPIEVYVNESGPYGINSSALNVFKTLREGVTVNYIYVGTSSSIGSGQTQTVAGDYIDVNATPVNPPSSTGGLDVPLEDGLIPVSRVDGSIVWEPKPTGAIDGTGAPKLTQWTTGWQSGLTFNPYAEWSHDGNVYDDTRTITLDAADSTYDRFDLLAVDLITKQIVVKKGTASANPVKPEINPETELEGVFIAVKAGTSAPDGVSKTTIYAEQAGSGGGEWDPSQNIGPSYNLASTTSPRSGTYAIETTQPLPTSQTAYFDAPAPILVSEITEVEAWIKYKGTPPASPGMQFIARGTDKNGKLMIEYLSGPVLTSSTAYQRLVAVVPTNTRLYQIDRIGIRAGNDQVEFFIDDWSYMNGIEPAPVEDFATVEFVLAEDQRLQDQIDDHEGRIQTLEASSGGSAPVAYATMADMYAAQANQVMNGSYRVDDASGHSKVEAGRAWFDYNGGTTGTEADYILRSEEESMNLDAQFTAIENRLTALEGENILNAPATAGKIPRTLADGSIEWVDEPTGGGSGGGTVITVASSRALAATDSGNKLLVTAPVTLTWPSGGITGFECNFDIDAGGQLTIADGTAGEVDAPDGKILEAGKMAHAYRRPDTGKLRLKGTWTA